MEKNKVLDLDSRDYDVKDIDNVDRRFEANKKDFILFHGVTVAVVIIATIFMFSVGSGKGDASNVKYVLGFPLWWVGATGMYLATMVWGMFRIKNWEKFPLTAREKDGVK